MHGMPVFSPCNIPVVQIWCQGHDVDSEGMHAMIKCTAWMQCTCIQFASPLWIKVFATCKAVDAFEP